MKRFVAFAVMAAFCGLGMVGCDDPTIPDEEIKAVEADPAAIQKSMQDMMDRRAKSSREGVDANAAELSKQTAGGN